MKLGEEFVQFLLSAKRETYASLGDEASVEALLPGSRQLEYREGPWFYRDIYFGVAYFVGQETVYHEGTPVWAMSYAGGVLPEVEPQGMRRIYAFLREALRAVPPEMPYRGPREFHSTSDGWIYRNRAHGELARFWGAETITLEGRRVYELHYSGGWVR